MEYEHDGAKDNSHQWLQTAHHRIEAATSVLALSVRESKRVTRCMSLPDRSTVFATDIVDMEVTLVHSRDQFLLRFARWMCNAGTVFLSLVITGLTR